MTRRFAASLLALPVIVPSAGAPARAEFACRLCASAPEGEAPARPLSIDIEATLDFSRVALEGAAGGSVSIDPQSGRRAVSGSLVDLGGMAVRGSARVTGEPFRHVVIDLPRTIRLSAPHGGGADVTEVETDLPPNPMLGADGSLSFAFGGKLRVDRGIAGELRGRIPITVEYR